MLDRKHDYNTQSNPRGWAVIPGNDGTMALFTEGPQGVPLSDKDATTDELNDLYIRLSEQHQDLDRRIDEVRSELTRRYNIWGDDGNQMWAVA